MPGKIITNSFLIRLMPYALLVLLINLTPATVAQDSPFKILTVNMAVNMALENNHRIENALLGLEKAKLAKGSSIDIPSTTFVYRYGQIYSPLNDRYIELNQNFGSLLTHISSYKTALSLVALSEAQYELAKKEMIAEVKSAYFFWIYLGKKLEILNEKKNLFTDLTPAAELHFKLGAINLLEKTTLITLQASTEIEYNTLQDDLTIARNKLRQLIMTDDDIIPENTEPELYMIDKPAPTSEYKGEVLLNVFEKSYEVELNRFQTEKSKLFPGISAGYFNQTIGTLKGFYGWQAGLSFPLWIFSPNSKISQAKINSQIAMNTLENQKYSIENNIENLLFELNKYFKQIVYYKDFIIPRADQLITTAELQYKKEEIEYFDYLQSISTGYKLFTDYYETLNNYNQTAIQLEFYTD